MEILKASNLKKTYGKGDTQVYALNDVSLTVLKGEFLAIKILSFSRMVETQSARLKRAGVERHL